MTSDVPIKSVRIDCLDCDDNDTTTVLTGTEYALSSVVQVLKKMGWEVEVHFIDSASVPGTALINAYNTVA